MLSTTQHHRFTRQLKASDPTLVQAFAALGDATRCRIFGLLFIGKELCVSDVAAIAHITVPTASHHLRILELSGLAISQRMGQMVCYEPAPTPLVRRLRRLVEAEE
ncbi:winged helix-turn-helix transcriptional regulator [Candidatus Berkelbacteria bacterium]|nr:winged helix-turn-helix transcriptional regulator [Candidatus Berkelbacteria bacterium]